MDESKAADIRVALRLRLCHDDIARVKSWIVLGVEVCLANKHRALPGQVLRAGELWQTHSEAQSFLGVLDVAEGTACRA